MNKADQLRHRAATLISVFTQTTGALSAILTILAFLALGTAVVGEIRGLIIFIIFGLGSLFIVVLLFIFIYSLLEDKKATPFRTDTIEYPPPPKEDIEILRKEIVYEYLADGKTIFSRKHLIIRMLRDNIHAYTDRYRWTGSGKCTMRSLRPEFVITNQHEQEEEEGIWNYFSIRFPGPYHKDDVVEFTIEWEMIDEGEKAVPFLSTMIIYETKYLILHVVLPHEQAPKRAYFHEFANFKDKLPSETKKVQWSPASRSIICEVTDPKKYHKYAIRWYYDTAETGASLLSQAPTETWN